ncbi:MAG TPA: YolD-like family protein [Bacilli bacterium]|nr:YolD-like family protein [Bacilli bacterium]
MKKYLPFASLREQAIHLNKMMQQKKRVDKPLISEDIKREINGILISYAGEKLVIIYYDNGFIKSIETTIRKIDTYSKKLILDDFSIKFTNLLNIQKI